MNVKISRGLELRLSDYVSEITNSRTSSELYGTLADLIYFAENELRQPYSASRTWVSDVEKVLRMLRRNCKISNRILEDMKKECLLAVRKIRVNWQAQQKFTEKASE